MNRRELLLFAGVAVVFSVACLAIGYWLGRTSATDLSIRGDGGPADKPSSTSTTPNAEEVKWAREVADNFLQAASQKGFYHVAGRILKLWAFVREALV